MNEQVISHYVKETSETTEGSNMDFLLPPLNKEPCETTDMDGITVLLSPLQNLVRLQKIVIWFFFNFKQEKECKTTDRNIYGPSSTRNRVRSQRIVIWFLLWIATFVFFFLHLTKNHSSCRGQCIVLTEESNKVLLPSPNKEPCVTKEVLLHGSSSTFMKHHANHRE